jgi:alkyl sulfatase BDS1-like metallo-beta-lactamase superfamily hydrolase
MISGILIKNNNNKTNKTSWRDTECNSYLRARHKVLDMGELTLPTQHQLLTLRGANIRDGLAWFGRFPGTIAREGGVSRTSLVPRLVVSSTLR